MIILTSKTCPKCSWLKKRLVNYPDITWLDADSVEALTEIQIHDLDAHNLKLPVLIDGEKIIGEYAVDIKRYVEEGGGK